jgi:hypothetical protein
LTFLLFYDIINIIKIIPLKGGIKMSQSITNASLSDFTDTIQISNQTGTRVQLHTANAYLKKDIELNLNV